MPCPTICIKPNVVHAVRTASTTSGAEVEVGSVRYGEMSTVGTVKVGF